MTLFMTARTSPKFILEATISSKASAAKIVRGSSGEYTVAGT